MSKKLAHRIFEPLFNLNPALKQAYKFYRHIKSNPSYFAEPQQTVLGFKFNGNPRREHGQFEQDETALVKKLIQDVNVVVNVGANIGYYICLAIQGGKRTIAFEPIPENLHFLLRNIKANGWESKAQVYPMALSNDVGIQEIYGGGTGASLIQGWSENSKEDMLLIPVSTLNQVLMGQLQNEKILFIVDIEGAEKMMLDGASDFINRNPRPMWLIEITSHQHQPKGVSINPHLLQTFERFWDLGYEAWAVESSLRKVGPQEIQDLIDSTVTEASTPNYLFKAAP